MPTHPISPLAAICYGPMKSGKSRYLVEQAETLHQQGLSFLAFKPVQDTRDGSFIRSRDLACRDIQAIGVGNSQELLEVVQRALQAPETVVRGLGAAPDKALGLKAAFKPAQKLRACLIDEVFLLDGAIIEVLQQLLKQGISVYLSGLDRDFRGEYFPLRYFESHGLTMQDLIRQCDQIIALNASCEVCQQPAALTQRLINGQPAPYDSPTVLIGDEEYEPRCLEHHQVLGHPHLSAVS